MALPPRFSSRVASSTVQQAQRRISNDGVARGVSLLARAGSEAVAADAQADRQVEASQARVAEAVARRDREAEVLRQGVRLTATEADASSAIAQLEREPAMFGDGHQVAVDTMLADRRSAFIEGLPLDERIRQRATAQWDAWAARQSVRAEAFEAGQRVTDQGKALERAGEQADALIFAQPTVTNFVGMLDQFSATLDGVDVGDGQKEEVYNERGRSGANALLSGLVDAGQWDQVEAMRKAPELSPFLTYEEIQRYGGLAENGRAMQAREVEMAHETLRDTVRGQIDNAEELLKQGVTDLEIPLPALIAEARVAGLDPVEITEAEGLAIGLEVNRRYSTTGELTSHIGQLEALDREGDLDEAGQRQLFYMRQRHEGLATQRAAEFEEGWDAGGRAQVGAVGRMMALPMADRVVAARALDPSGNLRFAVQLNNSTAQAVVRGQQVRAVNDRLLPTKQLNEQRYRRHFEAVTGNTLSGMSEEARAAIYDMSLDALADHMSRSGREEYTRDEFAGAIGMVMGRQRDASLGRYGGGLGSWNGQPVWLPPSSNQASFEAVLRGHSFEGAADPAEIVLRNYTPLSVATGYTGAKRYQFVDETGALLGRSDGDGPYELWVGG